MKHEKIEVLADGKAPSVARETRRSLLRPVLLVTGPLAVLLGAGYAYLNGGRYVSTDNAYVHASVTPVAAEVSGPISDVRVTDNQPVEAGAILFAIDRRPYEIALRDADAALDRARGDAAALKASYRQKAEEIVLAMHDRAFAEREWQRQQSLAARNVVSRSKLDGVRHDFDVAAQRVAVLRQDLARIAADLRGDPDLPVDQHPEVRQMLARRDRARLDLERTVVRAPISGRVSVAPSLGEYVAAGQPVLSVVSSDQLWVEANFKETELTHMRAGQAARIEVDTYPGVSWTGSVDSIAQATGAVFSVLPAQNASGNWVKVVQRIPVRIGLNTGSPRPVLRAGMSVEVDVDTGHRRSLGGLVRSALRTIGVSLE